MKKRIYDGNRFQRFYRLWLSGKRFVAMAVFSILCFVGWIFSWFIRVENEDWEKSVIFSRGEPARIRVAFWLLAALTAAVSLWLRARTDSDDFVLSFYQQLKDEIAFAFPKTFGEAFSPAPGNPKQEQFHKNLARAKLFGQLLIQVAILWAGIYLFRQVALLEKVERTVIWQIWIHVFRVAFYFQMVILISDGLIKLARWHLLRRTLKKG